MKDLKDLEQFRDTTISRRFDRKNGKFYIPMNGTVYQVIASDGLGWEHVSISSIYEDQNGKHLRMLLPSEMELMYHLFFNPGEIAVEIHPKKQDYVNQNESVLHLWRYGQPNFPLPPAIDVKPVDVMTFKENEALKLSYGNKEGWECYEVEVMTGEVQAKRNPTWDEMCMIKQTVCGDNQVAFQYHGIPTRKYTTRLWIPPKELYIPLPASLLVGIKEGSEKEQIKEFLKTLFK